MKKSFNQTWFYRTFLTSILIKWFVCFIVGIFFIIISLKVFNYNVSEVFFYLALLSWVYPTLITLGGFFYGIYKAITE